MHHKAFLHFSHVVVFWPPPPPTTLSKPLLHIFTSFWRGFRKKQTTKKLTNVVETGITNVIFSLHPLFLMILLQDKFWWHLLFSPVALYQKGIYIWIRHMAKHTASSYTSFFSKHQKCMVRQFKNEKEEGEQMKEMI